MMKRSEGFATILSKDRIRVAMTARGGLKVEQRVGSRRLNIDTATLWSFNPLFCLSAARGGWITAPQRVNHHHHHSGDYHRHTDVLGLTGEQRHGDTRDTTSRQEDNNNNNNKSKL